MSAFGGKADVRLTAPKSPLIAKKRHCTAVTAADPEASRLLDRTGVCGAGQGAPKAREMTIGRGFLSLYQPDKGRSAIYRTSLGLDSPRDTLVATFVGNQRLGNLG